MLLLEDSRAPVHSDQRSNTAWTNPGQLQEHIVCADVDGSLAHTRCYFLHAHSRVMHNVVHDNTHVPV